jgi:large subunit ribosomal protein L25
MAKEIVIKAATRTEMGSASARRLLKKGVLPAVIGGRDGKSIPIQLEHHAFDMLLKRHTGENLLVDLVVDERTPLKVLLTEVQRHSLTDMTLHADFLEISMTETMRVNIALELAGEPEGVRQGGILEQILFSVEVECLPGDLVESIEVDVSGLQLNGTLTVADLVVPPALKIVSSRDLPIVHVTLPSVAEETVEGAAAAAEGAEGKAAEPDVIAKGKKEEEEAE